MNMATIKPLDTEVLHKFADEHDIIVTVEEHQRAGGLGGAVVEYLSEHRPTRVLRLGVDDMFGQSGTPEELLTHYGLDSASIVKAVKSFLG
jgi:transketolase